MKNVFVFNQNNSGGYFSDPSRNVIVEADSLDEAIKKSEPHFTLCGGSGRYADYDDCGCCPCCGHRWSLPWNDKPEEIEELVERIQRDGTENMRCVSTSLVKSDGSILIADTDKKLKEIVEYISS